MITWIKLPDITDCQSHSAAWQAGISLESNLYAMYHSLDWLLCLDNPAHDRISIAEHCNGDTTTYAAFRKRTMPLVYQFSRHLKFAPKLSVLDLLGCDLVGNMSYASLKSITNSVWDNFPNIDAIYIKSVNVDSSIWREFSEHNWKIDKAQIYMPNTERLFHYVKLAKTHQEYIKGFKSKQRISFKRKLKKVNEAFPGTVELHRIDSLDDLDYLTESAKKIVQNSWKMNHLTQPIPESIKDISFLRRVTENGFLRSHVLSLDGKPCAFTVGYLYNGIYHCADTAYDINYAKHSPGTVLLYKAIEDIINSDQADIIHFGITDAQYKRELSNCHSTDASLMIMRPTLTNKLRVLLHRSYRDTKAWLKSRQDLRR
jgi:hypothetical protein